MATCGLVAAASLSRGSRRGSRRPETHSSGLGPGDEPGGPRRQEPAVRHPWQREVRGEPRLFREWRDRDAGLSKLRCVANPFFLFFLFFLNPGPACQKTQRFVTVIPRLTA